MLPLDPLSPLIAVALVSVVSIAAGYDYRYRRIPNWLSLAGLITGLALNGVLFGLAGLGGSARSLLFGFIVYFVLYLLRAMGAGDVKLMAAVSALAGPGRWFTIFVLTSLIGGVTALVLIALKGRVQHTFWNVGFIFSQLLQLRPPALGREELDVKNPQAVTLPAGVRIAAGVFAFLVASAIWGR
jgi:prepilin peptidase CpaA